MDKKLLRTVLRDKRVIKGIQLYNEGCVVDAGFNRWKVQSQEKTYNVFYSHGFWSCDCPHHTYRNVNCKHIHATKIHRKHTTKNPTLSMKEMIKLDNEIQHQITPRPLSSSEVRIQNMKTIIPCLN